MYEPAMNTIAIGLLSYALLLAGSVSAAEEEGPVAGQAPGKIALAVACILDSQPTKLRFTLTNQGPEDFKTTALAVNHNKLVFIKPDGEEVERVSWKRGAAEVVITPGEKCSWDLELTSTLELLGPVQAGDYAIRWMVGEQRAEEFRVVVEVKAGQDP
jgi:hypothetical protein